MILYQSCRDNLIIRHKQKYSYYFGNLFYFVHFRFSFNSKHDYRAHKVAGFEVELYGWEVDLKARPLSITRDSSLTTNI